MTGLLGGFTTFSAFSLETLTLVERGALGQAGLYVGLSVAGSLLAIAAGVYAMRSVLA
jgi:CrcB protein